LAFPSGDIPESLGVRKRANFRVPFGNQATGKPALGFASRTCDRFAFVEDLNATGMVGVKTSTRATSKQQIS
jgi:hypothetical protein